ncbi:hypothetical protein KAR34_04575 [bacterium]|nr:hypothetical protein [bacterium]
MFKKQLNTLILALVCLLAFTLSATATIQISKKMNYQGYLIDSATKTPINGTRNLRFRLYDAGGTALNWVETHNSVAIINGIFNVVLGESVSSPVMIAETFREPYYLEIEVYHPTTTSWETMAPQHLLSNAAYAMAARKVVYQQVLTVAHDGGDTCTVSGAIDMLLGQGAFTTALAPAPSISTQWVIEVKAGRYSEPGTFGGGGIVFVPAWVTVRGQGWNATELALGSGRIALADGSVLESLMITSSGNPVVIASGISYPYVRECKIEYVSDSNAPAIDISGSTGADIVDTTIFYAAAGAQVTGILAGGSLNCRVENCVVDLRTASAMGCSGITDGGTQAPHIFILENSVLYQSSGGPGSSIGIGVAGGGPPGMGRVSFNVTYNGNPAFDYVDTITGAAIVPGYGGPSGICNQDSTGALYPAF